MDGMRLSTWIYYSWASLPLSVYQFWHWSDPFPSRQEEICHVVPSVILLRRLHRIFIGGLFKQIAYFTSAGNFNRLCSTVYSNSCFAVWWQDSGFGNCAEFDVCPMAIGSYHLSYFLSSKSFYGIRTAAETIKKNPGINRREIRISGLLLKPFSLSKVNWQVERVFQLFPWEKILIYLKMFIGWILKLFLAWYVALCCCFR